MVNCVCLCRFCVMMWGHGATSVCRECFFRGVHKWCCVELYRFVIL